MTEEVAESTPTAEDPSGPSRRTFIATSTAVAGVVAGGVIGGSTLADTPEASAVETEPTSRVSLTGNA
ncbi:secreted protein [Kribbella sp. VKM Ac-2527]|uniref:Secreted protein n=1 Tax=Kribbella caucasensis TaxID=2512215 RepID=A0A4R6KK72_9ACTN|nr:twin-arginine translocation signal domain-containing protein [Kribbella sp. VKM Ac-2527]TDO51724.1 secreted protein [Kribbella sp. VKM Ac-2527]